MPQDDRLGRGPDDDDVVPIGDPGDFDVDDDEDIDDDIDDDEDPIEVGRGACDPGTLRGWRSGVIGVTMAGSR
jgi:hypothetical protein